LDFSLYGRSFLGGVCDEISDGAIVQIVANLDADMRVTSDVPVPVSEIGIGYARWFIRSEIKLTSCANDSGGYRMRNQVPGIRLNLDGRVSIREGPIGDRRSHKIAFEPETGPGAIGLEAGHAHDDQGQDQNTQHTHRDFQRCFHGDAFGFVARSIAKPKPNSKGIRNRRACYLRE
jgi:hypothetical protein